MSQLWLPTELNIKKYWVVIIFRFYWEFYWIESLIKDAGSSMEAVIPHWITPLSSNISSLKADKIALLRIILLFRLNNICDVLHVALLGFVSINICYVKDYPEN